MPLRCQFLQEGLRIRGDGGVGCHKAVQVGVISLCLILLRQVIQDKPVFTHLPAKKQSQISTHPYEKNTHENSHTHTQSSQTGNFFRPRLVGWTWLGSHWLLDWTWLAPENWQNNP